MAGSPEEARAAATGLIEAAEATRNPFALPWALLAYGFAFRDADPDRAREALHRGLVIAHNSGNRDMETHLAATLGQLEAGHGDPLAALDNARASRPSWMAKAAMMNPAPGSSQAALVSWKRPTPNRWRCSAGHKSSFSRRRPG